MGLIACIKCPCNYVRSACRSIAECGCPGLRRCGISLKWLRKLELIGRKTHAEHARCDTGACLLVNGIRDGCIAGAVLDGDVIAVSCYQILCN